MLLRLIYYWRKYSEVVVCLAYYEREFLMAKYGKKAQEDVEKAMREFKKGELTSGKSGKKVTSRKQAIAIGLSQARKAGAKVPKAPAKKS